MLKSVRNRGVLLGLLASFAVPFAVAGRQVSIEDRGRGAAKVVVGTVVESTAKYERNEFGDDLIVSRVRVAVEETLKGEDGPVTIALEGGTVDGITMRVASLPTLTKGERAVFFLTPSGNEFRPHLRGQGILKLDSTDHVRGTSLSLDEIRRLTRPAAK
jgi:hypothetical protein